VWDLTDRNGNIIDNGQYRLVIEGTMNNEDKVDFSVDIFIGDEGWEKSPVPVYSMPDSEYINMLSNIKVVYFS